MAIPIIKKPGELPAFWDRSVIFFANILSFVYGNESETQVLRNEVGALETYGSRLIPLINLIFRGGKNLLVLEREPDADLLNYFAADLELSLPEIQVLERSDYLDLRDKNSDDPVVATFLSTLKDHPAAWIDGYVTDSVLEFISQKAKKQISCHKDASERGNSKVNLQKFLDKTDLLKFDTVIAENKAELTKGLSEIKNKGYQEAVVKASIGASGIGMQKIKLDFWDGSNVDLPDYFFYAGPCLVQGWLDEAFPGVIMMGSPSVQMFLDENGCTLYDITEQILSHHSIHEGNIAPPPYLKGEGLKEELLRKSAIAAEWLHSQGYRGTASIDFHYIERDGQPEVRICEINARVTGATYPSVIARNFIGNGAWLMRNIRFNPGLSSNEILSTLDKESLLFKKGIVKGILPINFNPDETEKIVKGQFLFLGRSTHEVLGLLESMSHVADLKGEYDRD